MCRNVFLLHLDFSTGQICSAVQRSAYDLKLGVLVLHRCFHVSVTHGLHHGSQIPSSHENPCTVVMPCTVQYQLLRQTCLHARLAKQAVYRTYVATRRPGRREYRPFLPRAAVFSQDFEDPTAHRNEPSFFRRFTVGHEDQTVFPVEVRNAHSIEVASVSPPSITHQDDDVVEEVGRSPPPSQSAAAASSFFSVS